MAIFKRKPFIKLNLFDMTLLVFIVLVAVILYGRVFPLKSFKRLYDVPGEKWMVVDIVVPKDKEWIHKYIQRGDRQEGLQNKIFAEVVEVYYSQEFGSDKRLMLKMKVLASLEPGQYPVVFGRHPIIIGEPIVFHGKNYVIDGYIAKIEEPKEENAK